MSERDRELERHVDRFVTRLIFAMSIAAGSVMTVISSEAFTLAYAGTWAVLSVLAFIFRIHQFERDGRA